MFQLQADILLWSVLFIVANLHFLKSQFRSTRWHKNWKHLQSLLELVAGQKSNLFFSWKAFLYQGEVSCPPEEYYSLKHEIFSSFYFWRDIFFLCQSKKLVLSFLPNQHCWAVCCKFLHETGRLFPVAGGSPPSTVGWSEVGLFPVPKHTVLKYTTITINNKYRNQKINLNYHQLVKYQYLLTIKIYSGMLKGIIFLNIFLAG